MIIIIPIGGTGQRFKEKGYKNPKALINTYGKPIISHLLDNLNTDNIDYIFIPYNKEYVHYNFEEFLTNQYPNMVFRFLCLESNTRGAAETINIGINNLKETRNIPVICLDSDNFYTCDIISEWNGVNCVFTFEDENENENPIYSYVKTNKNNEIIDIKEKDNISNNACTGAYGFKSLYELKKYTSKIIKENITQKSEFYTSGVIKEMIDDNYKFRHINILNKYYFSLGTPKQVIEFEHPYIFDLDGTLVDTDNIYINVWNTIMKKYNIFIDSNFFNFYIQGKNDVLFLKTIFPDITDEEINKISIMKDNLFIEYLENYKHDILIDGALDFIKKNKNRKMGIVTSCNKKSAEFILKKTNIYDYIQFLIASEDCKKHKPNKEPYQRAIDILDCENINCTIFEDSNSGYKSAKSLGDTNICLILNNNSSEFIKKSNEYKIKSYNEFNMQNLNTNVNDKIVYLKEIIIKHLDKYFIKNIILGNEDLKTGYICDIKCLNLILNNTTIHTVLKIENEYNELSNVARKMNIYNNEVYFYEKISNIVNIEFPKFYCSFTIDNKNAILLENLNNYNGMFNCNLNNEIDIILLVVKNISEMHNMFLFNNKKEIIKDFKKIRIIHEISYYTELINKRFQYFLEINNILLTKHDKHILKNIYKHFNLIINIAGRFPLNFCHGDLKSPNIFYKNINNIITPIFLDWQYIHLNKGISDIVFLLVESTNYNEELISIILNYYYKKSIMYNSFNDLLFDFKIALCIFPFFVMIWFNSENRDNILDKIFPINFMKNTLLFYRKYIDDEFFSSIIKSNV